jgi:transposase
MNHIDSNSRKQAILFPPLLDEWLPKHHPARIIDLFVESIDSNALGIIENNDATGRPSYNPKLILKLLLYGYSEGERSSRKLERLTYENVAFMWLAESLHPDYRTIARFRQKNITVMKELLRKTIELYQSVEVEFNGIAFADGTKIFANASDDATMTEEKIRKLEQLAEKILAEVEIVDKREDERHGTDNKNFLDVAKLAALEEQIKEYKEQIKDRGGKFNTTDSDARFMPHPRYGKHTSYNAQLSVSEAGIILETDVTNEISDNHLLKDRVNGIEVNTGVKVDKIVADSGFYETNEVRELMNEDRAVVVPRGNDIKTKRGKQKKYLLKDFKYGKEQDVYICPEGKDLGFQGIRDSHGKEYRVYKANGYDCPGCANKQYCYRGRNIKWCRQIYVLNDREFLEQYKEVMVKHRKLIEKRKSTIEGVIGVLKFCFRFRRFLLRGIEKVRGEWSLMASAYNLFKIYKLIGCGYG